ncbi:hypothetical protein LINPERHAP1_LOCUS25229 [Linum perenne]
MNSALLAKWCWRFGVERTAWWRELVVLKCGVGKSEWRMCWSRNTSGWSVWRWIVKESLCFWKVGYVDPGGGWVSFWFDFWVPGVCLSVLFPRVVAVAQLAGSWVCDYFSLDRSSWQIPLVSALRGGAEQERRLLWQFLEARQGPVLTEGPAMLVWPLEASGCFTVRSLARALIKDRFEGCRYFPTEVVWDRYAPTKVSCLVWKVAHERLATIDVLRQRGFSMPNRCVMCGVNSESVRHLFWLCPFACEVWSFFSSRLSLLGPWPIDAKGFLWAWKGLNYEASLKPCVQLLVHSVLWVIWNERNMRIFQDRTDDVGGVIARITFWVGLWCKVGGCDVN